MSAWALQYENIQDRLPPQADVNNILATAKNLVAPGRNLQIPKAIAAPKGHHVKNAGKRKKGWYERGPCAKKAILFVFSVPYG